MESNHGGRRSRSLQLQIHVFEIYSHTTHILSQYYTLHMFLFSDLVSDPLFFLLVITTTTMPSISP